MPFTTLSDDFADQAWTLSDAAFRTHVEGLVWCNRKLTDCKLDESDLGRALRSPTVGIDELLEAGFWKLEDGVYTIVHNARFQRPREQVIAQQQASRRNGLKGGRPKTPRESEPSQVSQPEPSGVIPGVPSGKGKERKGAPTQQPLEVDDDVWTGVIHSCAGVGKCQTVGCAVAS